MEQTTQEGFEIDQKMMESLNVGDRFKFSEGNYSHLGNYEEREQIVNQLYRDFKHLMVSPKDEVFGLKDDKYVFIKEAKGLYQAMSSSRI